MAWRSKLGNSLHFIFLVISSSCLGRPLKKPENGVFLSEFWGSLQGF